MPKQPQMKTFGEFVAEDLASDHEFREEWERLAVARAVASKVIGYRADHGIAQRQLAEELGLPQPQVARLESGEYDPSDETLARLSSVLGMTFTKTFAPAHREQELRAAGAKAEASDNAIVASYHKRESAALFTAT
jgi:transcriptional regulator with XRE-family HTH domain